MAALCSGGRPFFCLESSNAKVGGFGAQRASALGMTGMSDMLTRYLDLTAEQMKVTAGNMANIDTPGYKAQGFDFEKTFHDAMSSANGSEPALADVDGLVARPDGNTVSIDRESLQMAKSQLQFRTGVELMKHEFSRVMSAIHAETK